MAAIPNVTHGTFKTEVLEAPEPILVDFYADRCGACRDLALVLVALAAEGHKIVKADTDDQPELADEYDVAVLPTLLVFKNGKVRAKLEGLQTKATLVKALKAVG